MTSLSHHKQVAALPYRRWRGHIEVLLITSRQTKRWVIPKGWPMDGKADHHAAAQEAYEEAGIEGQISDKSIGAFNYQKRKKSGEVVDCVVMVFAMEVYRLLHVWPEKHERRRQWFSAREAIEALTDEGLKAIIEAALT